jgi:hypothetical protein
MLFKDIKLAIVSLSLMAFSCSALAVNMNPRTCSAINLPLHQNSLPTGGSGGTGHEIATPPGGMGGTGNTVPPGGIGGTGIEANAETGGMGGTGNTVPPGGIGGTGIEANAETGGMGGTGNTIPPGGSGGSGIQANTETGGMGGTGNRPMTPPGGTGGTGVTMAGVVSKSHGDVAVLLGTTQKQALSDGDEICVGDKIVVGNSGQTKIEFTDGALLHVLKNSEVTIDDYLFAKSSPQDSRSTITLFTGDIRSVSGAISKVNPSQYAIKTPVATVRVIGTDFLVTHLPENDKATLQGTYVKVLSGEVSVISLLNSILLRAGESSHVLFNGIQSIINSGGTCSIP